jgi:hypothetical protein
MVFPFDVIEAANALVITEELTAPTGQKETDDE